MHDDDSSLLLSRWQLLALDFLRFDCSYRSQLYITFSLLFHVPTTALRVCQYSAFVSYLQCMCDDYINYPISYVYLNCD